MTLHTGSCRIWSGTRIVGFLMRRLVSPFISAEYPQDGEPYVTSKGTDVQRGVQTRTSARRETGENSSNQG